MTFSFDYMACLVEQRQRNQVLSRVAAVLLLFATNAFGAERTLDYDFDFESGQFNLNCSGNCPVISDKYARSGRYAMASTISDDSANVRRTEAVIPGRAKLMEYDRDYWIGFSLYLPEDCRKRPDGTFRRLPSPTGMASTGALLHRHEAERVDLFDERFRTWP